MEDIQTLTWILLQARIQKQITQTELARLSGVPRGRISDIENGRRQPTQAEITALAAHLNLSARRLQRLILEPYARTSHLIELFCPQKPRYRMPRERHTSIRLLTLRSRDRALFDGMWKTIRVREDWTSVRRYLADVMTESRYEAGGWMALLADGALPARLAPMRCGYRTLPVVVPQTHEVIGDCVIPALVDRRRGGVVFAQVTVLTPGEARMDGLVGMKVKGKLRWGAAEFDGRGHDPREDSERASRLRMPVVRFHPNELCRPGFAELFWTRVRRALWPAP